jgi:ABC-type multidrug transport system fused ATPase/permease subunit
MYLGQLIWPMFAAGWVLSLLERGKAAWQRLQPVLDAPLAVDDHGTSQGRARPDRRPGRALRLSRPVAAGARRRLAAPAAGPHARPGRPHRRRQVDAAAPAAAPPRAGQRRLRWNGVDLGDYTLGALREAHRLGAAGAFLFSASVADNIALARPDATRDEVIAARLAAVHDDILRLPRGYDTPVGERGVTLSGGQRQRVAIARALLADAPLLLLDDALSAVDTETEARILAHLRQARVGRTVVIASHRLSAVADADHTVVLRDGHVAEQGTTPSWWRRAAGTRASGATSNCRRASMPAEASPPTATTWSRATAARCWATPRACWCAPPRRSAGTCHRHRLAAARRGPGSAGPADRQVPDRPLPAAAQARLAEIGGLLAGALVAGMLASWLRYLQLVRLAGLAMRSVQRMREEVYGHVLRLPMASSTAPSPASWSAASPTTPRR